MEKFDADKAHLSAQLALLAQARGKEYLRHRWEAGARPAPGSAFEKWCICEGLMSAS